MSSESESEWGVSRGSTAEDILSTGCLYICRRRLGPLGSHHVSEKGNSKIAALRHKPIRSPLQGRLVSTKWLLTDLIEPSSGTISFDTGPEGPKLEGLQAYRSQMTQKPMLRADVYAHAMRAS